MRRLIRESKKTAAQAVFGAFAGLLVLSITDGLASPSGWWAAAGGAVIVVIFACCIERMEKKEAEQ